MSKMKIAVIGAGLMGCGIAQTCAQAEHDVINVDLSEKAIEKAKGTLKKIFEGKVAKGKISLEQMGEVLSRIEFSNKFEDVKGCEIIIEAVPENIQIKKDVFSKLDQVADENAILISNTSGLSISEIAASTNRPNKVMGVHFFYPAPVMKLVELIRGIATDNNTYEIIKKFAIDIGKQIVDAPEYPGFIVNRVLVPMQNEAAFLVMEGCKPEDVDNAMKLGANFPMGPLELTDFVGVDVMLATMNGLYNGFKDSKYRPCPLLENMVKAGHLGRKTGKGFYNYENS
ncbi:3-hydroxyacyl-CoA dehydrogenase NAD-binding domain-containing protein [Solobacterium sp.]|uniref:3-hydroxyacyl-CoA dehydrogenase family protein n=1 Tax=Solobacterium sp. TaxID=2060878 RepID=UPI001CAD9A9D|nr:3-hydroxyacyl-CoA dehydrogenase NAD-binding domain-containing protein [Solobacterium sp.]MBF1100049.1 NAD(P)-binding domain-containing protein [Solobacterium sp.]